MNFKKNSKLIIDTIRKIQAAETKADKKRILKENDTVSLRILLRLQFDSKVKHSLPEGSVPDEFFGTWPEGEAPANLNTIYHRYVRFLDGAPGTQTKKESHFLKIIGQLSRNEAEILIEVKDRKLKLGLSKRDIAQVFPGIF